MLVFEIDATRIPAGQTAANVAIFKDGVEVPACTGDPAAMRPEVRRCEEVPELIGEAPMFALTLVRAARPIAVTSSWYPR